MLILQHHVISDNVNVSTTQAWEMGYTVAVSSADGLAVPTLSGGAANIDVTIGIAGDKNRTAEANEWQNRVSDVGQETAASGKLTFYHGGGRFYIDIDDSAITTPGGTVIDGVVDAAATVTPGTALYRSATAPGGHFGSAVLGPVLAVVIEGTAELASGIPGEFEPGSSFDLADDTDNRNWISIQLKV